MSSWLKDIRTKCGLTHVELALKGEISRAYYTRIENGDIVPSPRVAKKIAKVLNFDWKLFYPDGDTRDIKEAM